MVDKPTWSTVRKQLGDLAKQAGDAVGKAAKEVNEQVERRGGWSQVATDARDAGRDLLNSDAAQNLGRQARQIWKGFGRRSVDASPDEPAAVLLRDLRQLGDLDPGQLDDGIQALLTRLIERDGPDGAREQIEALLRQLEAGEVVAEQHDERVRGVPAYQGGAEPVDPEARSILAGFREGWAGAYAKATARGRFDVHTFAAAASEPVAAAVKKGVARAAEALSGMANDGSIREAIEGIRDRMHRNTPTWVSDAAASMRERIQGAARSAVTMVAGLEGIDEKLDDPDALFAVFKEALKTGRIAMDPEADAVAVGYLMEAGLAAGAGAKGKEVLYIPSTGELTVSDLELVGARLAAAGYTHRPYVRNLYGSSDAIRRTRMRRFGEIGALIFHVGRGFSEPDSATGEVVGSWNATLGLGVNLSLPLLADQTVASVRHTERAVHRLTDEQQRELQTLLDDAPFRSTTARIRRTVGLGRSESPPPE